jgi:cyclic pyranopterin phosphate synthase
MSKLTHIDKKGRARMVDVSGKKESVRTAKASGEISLSVEAFRKVKENEVEKGDVLTVAKIAGIQAAKRVYELIPLCHDIPLNQVDLSFRMNENRSTIEIEAVTKATSKTGAEMEALTAVSLAALTIYDMVKAVDRGMVISEIKLLKKKGGKSGEWERKK